MLFYTKDVPSALFAKPLAGGPERQIVDFVGASRDFTVVDDGIYYCEQYQDGQTPVYFLSFSTGQSSLVTWLDGRVVRGFSVSQDRKSRRACRRAPTS